MGSCSSVRRSKGQLVASAAAEPKKEEEPLHVNGEQEMGAVKVVGCSFRVKSSEFGMIFS